MKNSYNSERMLPTWIETGTITAILVPLLYTAGWSFAYHYFDRFNLGLTGLAIPKEYFFLYSYWVVKDQFGPFFLLMSFFVLSLFLGRLGFQSAGNRWGRKTVKDVIIRIAQTILVPLLIFSMFWAFYCLGHRAAKNDYNEQVRADFPSYPRVRVWAEPPKDFGAGDKIGDEWQKGCYRLLMRNKDHLFLFYPGQPGDKLPTEIIPAAKVEMVRLLPQYESCED